MQVLGMAIAVVGALGILVVGIGYTALPRAMATSFGLPVIPAPEATAWLRLKGIRDLATGVVAGVLIILAAPTVVGAALLAFAIVPAGDALTVVRAKGSSGAAFGIHGATAAVMVAGGVALTLA